MEQYEKLAEELFSVLDHKHKGPPHEEMGAAVRGEMAVLRLLSIKARSMTAGDLSRLVHMSTPRIAAVLKSLEKKGMIVRSADKEDKRRVLVTLTEKGEAFCIEARRRALADVTKMLSSLGEEDAAHFVRIVTRIHEIMEESPIPGGEDKEEMKDE